MFLKTWRFITIILTALLMGTAFCHVLEMPAKMKIDGPLWMTLQQTLYQAFATVGGPIEIGAIIAATVLAFLVRGKRQAFYLTLVAAISLAAAFFVVGLMITNAVNGEVAKWTAESIPSNWMQQRAQWEYSHATRFFLQFIGFSALLLSILLETRNE
jgi:hypothetical protein